jgi:FAD/FMN-containing dehydrogenase
MCNPPFSSLFLFLGLSQICHGASSSTLRACEDLQQTLPTLVYSANAGAYNSEVKDYWSLALQDFRPACMVLPESAQDVSAAVQVLNTYPDVHFAVKGGGHDPNPGHATINDGVLISMGRMKGTTYDKSRNVALVKPGGEWNDVIASLETEGVTILGGRLGE